MAYLTSDNIKIFPSAYRGTNSSGQVYDPESRLFTEKNSGYPYRALSSVDDGNFVVSQENKKITFVLHGYYFEADFSTATNIDWTKPIYANIKIASKGTQAGGSTAYAAESLISWNQNQNTLDDNGDFTGVNFTNNYNDLNANYYLKIWDGNDVPSTSYQKFKAKEVQIGKGLIGEGYALSDLISDHSIGGVNSMYTLNKVLVGNQSGWLQNYAKLEPTKLSFVKNTSESSGEDQIVLDSSTNSTSGLTLNKKGITVNGADVNITHSGGTGGNLIASGNATVGGNIEAGGAISLHGGNTYTSGSGSLFLRHGDINLQQGSISLSDGSLDVDGQMTNRAGIEITEGNVDIDEGSLYVYEGNIQVSQGDILLDLSPQDYTSLRHDFIHDVAVSDAMDSSGARIGGYTLNTYSAVEALRTFTIDNVPKLYVKNTNKTSNLYLPLLDTSSASSGAKDAYVQTGIYVYTPTSGTASGTKVLRAPNLAEGTKLLEDKYIQKSAFTGNGQILVGTGSGTFAAYPTSSSTPAQLKNTHLSYNNDGTALIWTYGTHIHGKASSGSTQYFTSSSTRLTNTTTYSNLSLNQSPDALYYYVSSSGVTLYSNNFSGTNYYGTSDARLKENIVDTSFDSIRLLSEIKIRDFNWKKDKPENKNIGVIAQELEEILPEEYKKEFIYEGDYQSSTNNQYLAINDSKLIYVLIDAFKKLKAELDELKDKLGGK